VNYQWSWQVNDACAGSLKGAFITSADGRVAEVLSRPAGSQEECERRACLIAAAPELLGALQGMIEVYAVNCAPNSLADGTEQELTLLARAAVKKATGKQS
jgi:hypothetical protein